MIKEDCIFCKISRGDIPSYKIWEDDKFFAILDIFPNTKGMTLIIPKEHYDSYAFEMPDDVYSEFMLAAKKVGLILDDISAFEDKAGRPLLSAMAIYKDVRKNDHGDGFYYMAEKLGKGNARKLKRDLYGFAEAEACRVFWQNEEHYNTHKDDF